jgi:zinc transporter ZupT
MSEPLFKRKLLKVLLSRMLGLGEDRFVDEIPLILGSILLVSVVSLGGVMFLRLRQQVLAGGFIYIAGTDFMPGLHKRFTSKDSLMQTSAIMLGLFLMWGLMVIE